MRGLCISGTPNPDNEITSLIIWFVEDFLSLATEKLHSLGLGRGCVSLDGQVGPRQPSRSRSGSGRWSLQGGKTAFELSGGGHVHTVSLPAAHCTWKPRVLVSG